MSSDSTISDADAPESGDRQGMIEYYVDELILRMVESPHDSTPQLFRHMSRNGPCVEPGHVLHIFGGGIIFRRTCNRLNLIRDAALRDTLARIPMDLARWGGGRSSQTWSRRFAIFGTGGAHIFMTEISFGMRECYHFSRACIGT